MNPNIQKLIPLVLTDDEIFHIDNLIEELENGDREKAVEEIRGVLGTKPKRPLYYIDHEIYHLPKTTVRNIMRYSGDYVDQLVRFALSEKRFLSRWIRSPLGPNVRRLKKYINNPGLIEKLEIFNKIYTEAKHEFNHRTDKSYFCLDDGVYFIYITKKIAEDILNFSEYARDYNNEGNLFYSYNPKD